MWGGGNVWGGGRCKKCVGADVCQGWVSVRSWGYVGV